jgi:hypothetical protein
MEDWMNGQPNTGNMKRQTLRRSELISVCDYSSRPVQVSLQRFPALHRID